MMHDKGRIILKSYRIRKLQGYIKKRLKRGLPQIVGNKIIRMRKQVKLSGRILRKW
jgi:uncharacterized protein YbcI